MATEDIYKEKRVEENKGGRESGFWIPIDCLQIDTKDILFICGGAFVDIEKTISERRHDSSIGFGAPVRANMRMGGVTNAAVTSNLMETVESSDLMKTKQEVVHLRQDGGWNCWS